MADEEEATTSFFPVLSYFTQETDSHFLTYCPFLVKHTVCGRRRVGQKTRRQSARRSSLIDCKRGDAACCCVSIHSYFILDDG